MKVACFSDLHLMPEVNLRSDAMNHDKILWAKKVCEENKPDVVVVAGDVQESDPVYASYSLLAKIFKGYKVIFTLGNHEFFDEDPLEVRELYADEYHPGTYDVHCLDVLGYYDIDGIRFIGNVLWYDGSMKCVPNQDMYKWGGGRWMDMTIKAFDYEEEFNKCYQQIKDHYDDSKKQVLVTHCVPHIDLNMHPRDSEFNAFSGCAWLLDRHKFDYAICGHTHWRDVGRVINGCECVNVGAAYWRPYQCHILDI